MTLQAFRLAEDHRILLPVMVNMDGFTLSHMIEPVSLLSKEDVAGFLPPMDPFRTLDINDPRSFGPFGAQDVYTEIKMQQENALVKAQSVMEEIWSDFNGRFGRSYRAVETHRSEDARIILVTMAPLEKPPGPQWMKCGIRESPWDWFVSGCGARFPAVRLLMPCPMPRPLPWWTESFPRVPPEVLWPWRSEACFTAGISVRIFWILSLAWAVGKSIAGLFMKS